MKKALFEDFYLHLKRREGLTQHVLRGDTSCLRGCSASVFGHVSGRLYGDITGVRGDLTGLIGDLSKLCGDVSQITGQISGLRGDVSNLSGHVCCELEGDATGIDISVNGLKGNFDDCELTKEERKNGVSGFRVLTIN